MISQVKRTAPLLMMALLVTGCANEKAASKQESLVQVSLLGDSPRVEQFLIRPLDDAGRYAMRISESYKILGDNAARNRDIISTAILTSAGLAAAGYAAGVATTDAAQVALAGGVIYQGAQYARPDSAAASFYAASDQLMCIGTTIAEITGGKELIDVSATAIALRFIRHAEILLRNDLQRTIPDPKTIASALSGIGKPVADDGVLETNWASQLSARLPECFPTVRSK